MVLPSQYHYHSRRNDLKKNKFWKRTFKSFAILGLISGLILLPFNLKIENPKMRVLLMLRPNFKVQPLVMQGGDPYIRALMRTITASEANVKHPYNVIYGGEYISDLSQHPDKCTPVGWRVSQNHSQQCSTAAGRYQFLNITWNEKAKYYHPLSVKSSNKETSYSFEPQYQDAVVYGWLSDSSAWGVDIRQSLYEGEVKKVFELLSDTWTSLGYGIESNYMTPYLPEIYQKMLDEELKIANISRT